MEGAEETAAQNYAYSSDENDSNLNGTLNSMYSDDAHF